MILLKSNLGFLQHFFLFEKESGCFSWDECQAEQCEVAPARARGWQGRGQISLQWVMGQHLGAGNGPAGPWLGLGTAGATALVAGERCGLQGIVVALLPPHGQLVWTCRASQP